MSICNEVIDLKGLPQKSNDFLSLFKVYSLNPSFREIIKSLKNIPPNFAIIIKNNKYQCHLEIVAAVSNLILKSIQSNPKLNEFSITEDFDDSKFDQFISFLHGENIKIADDNRSYFKFIAKSFQIDNDYFDLDHQNELSLNRFARQFHLTLQDIPKTVILSNEKGKYSVNYLTSLAHSQLLKKSYTSCSDQIQINLSTSEDISEIVEFLNHNSINVNIENFKSIKEIVSELEIASLNNILEAIMSSYKFLMPTYATINLHDTVLDLNDTNIDEVHDLLSKSEYYLNSDLHKDLCLAIELAFEYRPRYFENVIKLISMLQNDSFHRSLLKYLNMRLLSFHLSVPFLRSLYDSKNINRDELIELLKTKLDFDDLQLDYSIMSKLTELKNDLLVFFAKEFYELDKDEFIKKVSQNNTFYSANSRKCSDLQEYIDNWDKYEKDVNMHSMPNSLYYAITKDDVDTFQTITSQQSDFNFNQVLKPFLFEKHKELNSNITYIDLAAFYGAIRCFRFLILQQVDIMKSVRFAVYGGHSEIIRLIEQENGDFSNCFDCSIKYHRNDIFKWLLMNHEIKSLYLANYRLKIEPAIPVAIESYNNRAFLYFYELGIENNSKDESISLIGRAVQSLNADAVKLMLATYHVNPDKIHIRLDTPTISLAARSDCLEVVKLLIENGKCQIPKYNKHDPLMIAVKYGFIDIVEYLIPFYKDSINNQYIDSASNEKIKEILLSAKK